MKKIVITGCTRGLGRALTEWFSDRDTMIFGCGRSETLLEELRLQFPDRHRFSTVDIADDDGVQRWATAIIDTYGAPDLLINNAAIIAPNAPLWEVSREDFDAVIDVNIKGVANVIRHFTPAMIQRGSGVIVNFSSGWGRSTSPEVAVYCASKWAIEGLTGSLAQELPKGMAAVALNPGIIDTEMLQSCFGEEASGYPDPAQWVKSAGPFIDQLTARHNGQALTVPG